MVELVQPVQVRLSYIANEKAPRMKGLRIRGKMTDLGDVV